MMPPLPRRNSTRFAALALCWIALSWPQVPTARAAERIAFISDLNGRYGSTEYNRRVHDAVAAIIAIQPDLVVSTGDMVAGQSQKLSGDDIDAMWNGFNDSVANPLDDAGLPLAVTPGNHDGSALPGFAAERQRYEAQWRGRQAGLKLLDGSEWPNRYAVRHGGVLMIAFDGTRPGTQPATETRFLESMLETYAGAADTVLVFSHLPMWPLAAGRERDIVADPELLDLMHRHDVDVYASGHHHVFYPGVDAAGLLHLGVGALGGNVRRFTSGGNRQPFSFVDLQLDGDTVDVQALAEPGFDQAIDLSGLPEHIEGPLGTLTRLDLWREHTGRQ